METSYNVVQNCLQLKILMSISHSLKDQNICLLLISLRTSFVFHFFHNYEKMKIYKNENFLIVKVNKSMSHIYLYACKHKYTQKHNSPFGLDILVIIYPFSLLYPCFINIMFKLHNKSNILITYVIDFPF